MLWLAFTVRVWAFGAQQCCAPTLFQPGQTSRPGVQLLIVPEAESHVVGALRK